MGTLDIFFMKLGVAVCLLLFILVNIKIMDWLKIKTKKQLLFFVGFSALVTFLVAGIKSSWNSPGLLLFAIIVLWTIILVLRPYQINFKLSKKVEFL